MKKSTKVWVIAFIVQFILFSSIVFVYRQRGYYDIQGSNDRLEYKGRTDKGVFVVNAVNGIINESNDPLPPRADTVEQSIADGENHWVYEADLVKNKKNEVVVRIRRRNLHLQEASREYLTFDMTKNPPVMTKSPD